MSDEDINTLEIILKVRKEQKEIIGCAGGYCVNCDPDIKALQNAIYVIKNSIPVEKIKDMLEKLKIRYKTALEKGSTEAFILKCQITILQELLEEK